MGIADEKVDLPASVSDVGALIAWLGARDARSASFIGRVRGEGDLTELFLDHHPAMTEAGLADLAHAATDRWQLSALTLIHRVGAMVPGETIVFVLTSSAHRAEALAACEFLIDRLKTDVMLWKRETFADGRVQWVEPREGDQDRAERWG
ncbi:MAG: molybdenum cofactor biosynthesis protein MoaE [Sphingomonadales bacterium]|nr:MAG: molybdenum cofactor biosynthesis protein MoaE [Sphingomonadales bacterium]